VQWLTCQIILLNQVPLMIDIHVSIQCTDQIILVKFHLYNPTIYSRWTSGQFYTKSSNDDTDRSGITHDYIADSEV
jgi:hypothetical protein